MTLLLELPVAPAPEPAPCQAAAGHYFRRVDPSLPLRWRCVRCGHVPPVRQWRGQLTLFGRNAP